MEQHGNGRKGKSRARNPRRLAGSRGESADRLKRRPEPTDPNVEAKLDAALEETFPASDPVSIMPSAD